MSIKERVMRAIQELPEDANYRAISQKLDFLQAVDEGLQQSKAGKILSAEAVHHRLKSKFN